MVTATVTSKGQVVIPKELRDRLGIHQGTKLGFSLENGAIQMQPLNDAFVRGLYGSLKGRLKVQGKGAAEWLQAERKRDRTKEEKLWIR
jgi:AbrB family looped-hinge helix DNA binding protein